MQGAIRGYGRRSGGRRSEIPVRGVPGLPSCRGAAVGAGRVSTSGMDGGLFAEKMFYRIADIRIATDGEVIVGPMGEALRPFGWRGTLDEADVAIHIGERSTEDRKWVCTDRFACVDGVTQCLFGRDGEELRIEIRPPNGACARFRIGEEMREVWAECSPAEQGNLLRFGLWIACNAVAVWHGAVSLHAAAIAHSGAAVLFLGESGTGKSTQARIWCRHIPETEPINDDSPFVGFSSAGEAVAYGSPWSGKTPCYKSLRVPIAGIVRLEQGPCNKLMRLKPIEALGALVPSTPPPLLHDKLLAARVCAILSRLVEQVPVYRLMCRPEADAARLLWRELFGPGEVLGD